MDLWCVLRAEMVGRHHDPQRLLERLGGIGEDFGDAGESLVLLGVENVKDHADEQRMAGLFPMGATFKRAFRIDQNVSDVLNVADFGSAPCGPQAADCTGHSVASVGSNNRQCEKRERQPAVRCQFSPLMS